MARLSILTGLLILSSFSLVSSESDEVENLYGPEEFFTKDFYLKVTKGIVVHVFKKGSNTVQNRFTLSQRAKSVSGSYMNNNKTIFSVTLDWKSSTFQSRSESSNLNGIIFKMEFLRKGREFTLTQIVADNMNIDGSFVEDLQVKVVSKYGYIVSAPLGSSFDCPEAGMFQPAKGQETEDYRIGLSFPGIRLQVFNMKSPKFGPSWSCEDVMSIGLWIGLLVTLFFALICFWGFSMLANIQTMDRFDDPKGKPIHVPQTE